MPIKVEEHNMTGFRAGFYPEEEQKPSFARRFVSSLPDAALEMNSPVAAGSAITEMVFDPPTPEMDTFDPEYEVYTDPDVQPYIELGFGREFLYSANKADAMRTVGQLSSRVERLNRLQNAGGAGVLAEFTMGAIDPIAAIGFLGGGAKALNAIRVSKNASMATRIGASAAEVGLSAGSGVAVAEGIRQASLPGLSAEESAWNIGGATLIAGAFGAGLPVAAKALGMTADQIAARVDRELAGLDDMPPVQSTAGAAEVPNTTLQQETLTGALGLEKATAFISPIQRMMTSPSVQTRRYAQELVSNPLQTQKGKEGIAPSIPVEYEIEKWQRPLGQAKDKTTELFVKHRTGTEGGRVKQLGITTWDTIGRGTTRPDGKLTMKEFLEEVGEAMANGDEHPIAEVAEAAKHWRKTLFDPILDAGIKAELWPEDIRGMAPKTAQSYVTRIYNVPKIMAEEKAFQDVIYKHFMDERNLAARQLEKLQKDFDQLDEGAKSAKLADEIEELKYRAAFLDEELYDIAGETVGRIKGLPDGRLPYSLSDDVPGRVNPKSAKSGVFKARSLTVPDEMIKPWLIRNIFDVADTYTRRAVPDIELSLRFGDMDLTRVKQNIQDDYAKMKQGVKDGKKMAKINQRMEDDIRDIAAMRDRLRNVYGLPQDPTSPFVRASHVMRAANLLTKMGDVVRSSLSDIGRPIMTQGLTNVMKHGLLPLMRDFKGTFKNMKDAGLTAAVMEMSNNTRMSRAADIGDMYAGRTALERTVKAGTDTFGLVSGMSLWNQTVKEWTCMIARSRILETSVKWKKGKISTKDKARLAESFIDEKLAMKIADMAEEVDGVWLFKDTAPEDPDVARALSAALWREANSSVVTPGAGQLPLWVSTETGRFFWQFRSFMLAAHQSVMLSGLQRKDRATMWGALASVAIGSGVYALKTTASGREVSDNPATWIAEGIDRSGVMSLFFEINNTLEKVSGNEVGIRPMLGAAPASRFASRGKLESLAGPNVGMLADLLATSGDVMLSTKSAITGEPVDGGISGATVHRMRRTIIPYQNYFLFRGVLDEAEKGVNATFGLE
jgi:hypothetical protein